jgi:hypothetical protein
MFRCFISSSNSVCFDSPVTIKMTEDSLQNLVSVGRVELIAIQFKYTVPFFKQLLVWFFPFFVSLLFPFPSLRFFTLSLFSSLIYFYFTLILSISGHELRTVCFASENYVEDSFLCPSVGIGACVIMSCAQRRKGVPCH